MLNKNTGFANQVAGFFKKWSVNEFFLLYSLIVILVSFFTFFNGYQNPSGMFWDENYHVAASQKYIDQVYFTELHPPLGKLFIALGEKIFDQNKNLDKSSFTTTDYIGSKENPLPDNFSFTGVRFFPALFGFLSVYLFFILLYLMGKNVHLAFLFTSLFAFDNTMIVHFRGAMLESTQMFFILLALIWFVNLFQKNTLKSWHYIALGSFIGLVISVKINGLILAPLGMFLFTKENWKTVRKLENLKKIIFDFILKASGYLLGICIVFVGVQYIHQITAHNIIQDKKYGADQSYLDKLSGKGYLNPLTAIYTTKEWIRYSDNYSKGVPKLDETKSDENGSYPSNWPVGRRAISYRWDRYPIEKTKHFTYNIRENGDETPYSLESLKNQPDEEKNKYIVVVKYLFLIINPFSWLIALIGLVLCAGLILAKFIFGLKIKNQYYFNLILTFSTLYLGYLFTVIRVNRVLYLYHYFIPLVFSFILTFLVFNHIIAEKITNPNFAKKMYISVFIISLLVFVSFVIYSPFSYYLPLSEAEFNARNLFDFWGMRSAGY